MNVQARVALDKQAHPERYCKEPRCLWKVMRLNRWGDMYEPDPKYPDGRCPRHQRKAASKPDGSLQELDSNAQAKTMCRFRDENVKYQ